jgi:NTP pyrophosphatase (non-canonical NTP hydrolase)
MGAVGVKALVRPFFCYATATKTAIANTTATATTTATKTATATHDRNPKLQPTTATTTATQNQEATLIYQQTYKPDNLMTRYEEIITKLIEFRNERDWEQFHDAKNLALALMLEAAELNELFLWKKEDEIDSIDIDRIKEELADVLTYSFFLAHKYNLDIFQIVEEKMIKNGQKYPREKARGTAKKYTEL